ncbi:MAG: IS630 family transposase [Actinobacteria bacterium]|nr:IS630 family transposase [Actinomycetota bacterium]MCA1704809.1 IS630 family transposase [Actinomycetota bacterium]
MAITLPDARQLPDEVLEELRLRALRGCEMGFSQIDVAEMLGVARETVSRWWSAYQGKGVDGLPGERTGRPPGSGRTLTDEQGDHIQRLIDENTPAKLGIEAPLWSRGAVRELIRKEYGIDMPVRTVGEYLKRWGYTAKKPNRHANDQDPEEVREWLEEEYPEIERQAEQEGAVILWCDECGVDADHHPGAAYAPEGERATMDVPHGHIRRSVISAVGNEGECHFMTYAGTLDAAMFILFLEGLLTETSRKVYLITDRLGAHDAVKVWAWVIEHQGRIDLFLLPRRSPELNPDEYLNNDLKGNVHRAGLSNDEDELADRIHAFLLKLLELPGRVMSYFQHPSVQYAAG